MNKQLLEIQPKELTFIFELKKQSSCSMRLTNNAYHNVAFKVKTTSPKKYCVRPNVGIIMPRSTCEFTVIMQAQKVVPPDMVCKDKFLIQSKVVPVGTTEKDITASMFTKDNGNYIEDVKLRVVLISPPQSSVLSPNNDVLKQGTFFDSSGIKDLAWNEVGIVTPQNTIAKDVEHKVTNSQEFNTAKDEELKPKLDEFDDEDGKPGNDPEFAPNKDVNGEELKPMKIKELESEIGAVTHEQPKLVKEAEFPPVENVEFTPVKAVEELKLVNDIEKMKLKLNVLESKLNEAESTISQLTEERRLSIQERKILQEELAVLKSRMNVRKAPAGFPFLFVVMVAVVSVVLGYLSRL